MATKLLASQEAHGCISVMPAAGCSCSRPSWEQESCGSFGLSNLQGAIPSADFCPRLLHAAKLRVATISGSLL